MRQLIDQILESDIIALDTETTGLNVRKDRVIGIGAASKTSSIYIPLLVWTNEQLIATPHLDDAMYLLNKLKNKKLVLHNAAYDLRIIKHDLGIDLLPALHCDTILLKHTVDEVPPFGLKEIAIANAAALGFDRDPTLEKKLMEASIAAAGGKHTKDCYELFKANSQLIGEYCVQDCKLTLSIYEYYSKKLEEEGLVDFYYKDEVLPLYKEVSIPMMERGIKLDLPKIRLMKEEIEKDLTLLEVEVQEKLREYSIDFKSWFFEKEYPAKPAGNFAQELAEHFDLPLPKTATGRLSMAKAALAALPDGEIKEFLLGRGELSPDIVTLIQQKIHGEQVGEYFINISSKDHLKRIIFNFLGEKPERHTEKGAYQLDDDFLHSIEHKYSFIPPLLVYNKLNKIRSTYIDRFLEQQEDGIFYPQFNQHRTISGRFGSDIQQLPRKMEEGHPLVMKYTNAIRSFFITRPFHTFVDSDYCLHPNTELLTQRGWVKVLDVDEGDQVWQVEPNSLEGSWVKPSRVVKRQYDGLMYTFGNRRGSFTVTENHTMLWVGQNHKKRLDKAKYRLINKSQDLIQTTGLNILKGSATDNTLSDFASRDLNMVAMLSADGNIISNRKDYYRVDVSKDKKIKKITELTKKAPNRICEPRPPQKLPPHTWYIKFSHELLLDNKMIDVMKIGSNQIDEFVQYLAFWDGHIEEDRSIVWGSINKVLVENIQAKLVMNGYEAKLNIRTHYNPNHSTFYYLRIKKSNRFRVRKHDHSVSPYSGLVGCVTVETGFILIRNNGQTFVTGNCALEPTIFSAVSGDPKLQNIFKEDVDFYSTIAIDVLGLTEYSANPKDDNYLGKINKSKRTFIKGIALGVPYGMESFKLSKELNISQTEAQRLIDQYMAAYPNLKKWMQDTDEKVKKIGYVTSLVGRRRRMPEALQILKETGPWIFDSLEVWKMFHESPTLYEEMKEKRRKLKNYINNGRNFQIQSLAASVMNRAAIAINREFKKEKIPALITCQIHDQLVVEVKKEYKDKAANIMQTIMESIMDLPVPLKAPPSFGNNFSESH